MTETTTRSASYRCPHCHKPILSPRVQVELNYARKTARKRGGYIWEGARPAYESGKYRDNDLAEMLACGALQPHPDPAKGWVVTW